jgi:hypothetical protein
MSAFLARDPTLKNYWMAVILFGQNFRYDPVVKPALVFVRSQYDDALSGADLRILSRNFTRNISTQNRYSIVT